MKLRVGGKANCGGEYGRMRGRTRVNSRAWQLGFAKMSRHLKTTFASM